MDYTDTFPRLFSNKSLAFKIAVIFMSALFMALSYFVVAVFTAGYAQHPLYIYAVQGVLTLFAFFIPALLCAFLFHSYSENTFAYLGQTRLTSLPVFCLGIVLMLVCVAFSGQLGAWNQMVYPMDETQKQFLLRLLTEGDGSYVALRLLVMALIPALAEEMFFRGLLQNTLVRYIQPYAALVLTSLVFALVHMDMSGVLPRFVLGALLGYQLLRSGSLWLPITCHFINNALVVVTTYYFFDADAQQSSLDSYVEGNILLFLISAVVFGLLLCLFKKVTER